MTATVYGVVVSPPVRSVLIVAKLVGRPTELKVVDLRGGEHLKPEFLKMNPLHTVPVIEDEGFILFESHAITTYLVDKYGKSDSLYPKDLQTRAIVNQRLFFNHTLFLRMRDRVAPLRPGGDGVLKPEALVNLQTELNNLNTLIGDNQWVAATDQPTVADIALLCSLDNLEALMETEITTRANVYTWLKRVREWAEANCDTYKTLADEAKAVVIQLFAEAAESKSK